MNEQIQIFANTPTFRYPTFQWPFSPNYGYVWKASIVIKTDHLLNMIKVCAGPVQ